MKKNKPSLYLETSTICMYFEECNLHLKDLTKQFWDKVLPDFEVYVSDIVIAEIGVLKDTSLQRKIFNLIRNFKVLKEVLEIIELSDIYLSNRKLPRADALHLAFASIYEINFLVTWNLRHIYKPGTQKMICEINTRLRLPVPIILTPKNFFSEV